MKRLLLISIVSLIVGTSCTGSSIPTDPSSTLPPISPPMSSEIVRESISFNGEVSRGQTFEKKLGQNLIFRLEYFDGDGEGWEIWVGDTAQSGHNYVRYTTPPYRGLNGNTDIMGWHFRNADNSGPRTSDDIPVPQEVKKFHFILNETDYETAGDSLKKLMWSYDYSEEEVDRAWEVHRQLQKATGVLTITHIELGNLVAGEMAWINNFQFTTEFWLPTSGD